MKPKRMAREYMGYTIFWSDPRGGMTGCRLPWTAMGPGGQFAADTLAGIKECIREAEGRR